MARYHRLFLAALVVVSLTGCFRRIKYENPITRETAQPDKVLFDKAIEDLEKGRYQVARLTLQTLINTYDTSEYLARAKLALADSWFREGGSHGLAQAEAEYKDFILFYPNLEEAAEAQAKICMIHYRQMEKPDRDPTHAVRADEECRLLMEQFPNSVHVAEMEQRLREIQEVIAEGEFRVGEFYFKKGSYAASVNRLENLVNHYPLFSKADQALWHVAQAYERLGSRFQDRAIAALQRIVRDYPLSPLADEAKRRLRELEAEIPEPDPVALARMEYDLENKQQPGLWSRFWGAFRKNPDVREAAKSGTPASEPLRPTTPITVPGAAGSAATGATAEVTIAPVQGPSALDTQPDARRNPPQQQQQQR